MEQDDLEFDEPAVRRAVQRAWGDEHAPQRLRGRISRLMATAGPIDGAAEASVAQSAGAAAEQWWSRAYAMAAAAIVVLAVGLLVLYYQGTFDPKPPGPRMAVVTIVPSKTTVPLTLTRSMLATHAACGKLHDHHSIPDLDGNTYADLTVRLTADLGFPTLVRSIGSDWTFEGAGECVVGDLRGAHLLFSNGVQAVSVFSLPASCMNGVRPGAQYEGVVDGHPVAGFARPGAVYAVVGGLRASSAAGATASPGPVPSLEAVLGIRSRLLEAFDIGCSTDTPDELLFLEE